MDIDIKQIKEKILKEIDPSKMRSYKKCLSDTFENGKFWAYKDCELIIEKVFNEIEKEFIENGN